MPIHIHVTISESRPAEKTPTEYEPALRAAFGRLLGDAAARLGGDELADALAETISDALARGLVYMGDRPPETGPEGGRADTAPPDDPCSDFFGPDLD